MNYSASLWMMVFRCFSFVGKVPIIPQQVNLGNGCTNTVREEITSHEFGIKADSTDGYM